MSGVIERYRQFLSFEGEQVVSLGEGSTPLLPLDRFKDSLGIRSRVYAKCEFLNPTGSFKDRGMTLAITRAKQRQSKIALCASTGNTAASAAAYSARAGMRCIVMVPGGKVASGKLQQAMIHGATVLMVKGTFDAALDEARDASKHTAITLVNSLNPDRIEGQKTAAFEIVDDLGCAPSHVFMPVGNAGNISAYWRGFVEYKNAARTDSLPRIMGYQAEGAAPIVRGAVVESPSTIAQAICIGNPASWQSALRARDESLGAIDIVSDGEMLAAYERLAETEGLFCELASAASLAGLVKASALGLLTHDSLSVCILTGAGLKDPATARAVCGAKASISCLRVDEVPEALKALSEGRARP